jgi:nucleoside-diphosphate kinase
MEKTLVLIKPDAVGKNQIGNVLGRFEEQGLKVIALKMLSLSQRQGATFYRVHEGKAFYPGLVDFIASGPIVALILEGEQAIARTREIMGATDPLQAKEGTIRREIGTNGQRNAVHGSDSPISAATEIPFFFSPMEIFPQGNRGKEGPVAS